MRMRRSFNWRRFAAEYRTAARCQWHARTRETITTFLWGMVGLGFVGVWRSGFTWEGVVVLAGWTALVVFWTLKARAGRRSVRHDVEITHVDGPAVRPYYVAQCLDCDWISRTYAAEEDAIAGGSRHGPVKAAPARS